MSEFIILEIGTGGVVFDDECWLIKKLKEERRKIIAVIDQAGASQDHAIVVYGIKRKRNGDIRLYYGDQNGSNNTPVAISKLSGAHVKYLH